jgi:hypothetical protein
MSGGSFPALRPSPKIFPVPDPCYRGIFNLIPVLADFHGAHRDPQILNINKKKLYFSVKIMTVR